MFHFHFPKLTLKVYLKKILHASPLFVIKTYSTFYFFFYRLKSICIPITQYNGIAREGGRPLRFCYIGRDSKTLQYWLSRIYQQYEKNHSRKLIPYWKLDKGINETINKYDLAIIEQANEYLNQLASQVAGFVLPRWLKMYMDIDTSLSLIGDSHDIRKRIRRHQLDFEIGHSEKDFLFFYEKMYKPYIERRHKKSAVVENSKMMLEEFKRKKSVIYFIIREGQRIAGLYLHLNDENPYLHAVGVLEGSDTILRMGVIGALYYFVLDDLRKSNFKRIDIGGTSPLLKDGLTAFKFSLGAMAIDIKNQKSTRLKLLPINDSCVVREFLISNTFVYFENGDLYCAVFKNNASEVTENKFPRHCFPISPLITMKSKVFSFDEQNNFSKYMAKT
jgi:hypothetical protein